MKSLISEDLFLSSKLIIMKVFKTYLRKESKGGVTISHKSLLSNKINRDYDVLGKLNL
jgi:hypothetical protein